MIEKYIQFAIDNFDKFCDFDYKRYEKIKVYKNYIHLLNDDNCKYNSDNLIELITSKPFIEAVARGIEKEWIILDCPLMWWEWNIENSSDTSLIEKLSFMLISAIRENELEEFIKKILPKK